MIASGRERGDGGDLARPRGRNAGRDPDPETERDAGDTDHAPDLTRTLAENTHTGTLELMHKWVNTLVCKDNLYTVIIVCVFQVITGPS